MAKTTKLIFISGGVRSGKSSFAEKIAVKEAKETNGFLHYVATGVASDIEMKKRINRHQQERLESKFRWKTWEQPTDISQLTHHFSSKDIILLDCLTTLLNNEFFVSQGWNEECFQSDVQRKIIEGIQQIKNSCQTIIVVSNEVLSDVWRENDLVFTYSQMIGKLHQRIVDMADYAYIVEAGIPILKKGEEDRHERSHDSGHLI